MIQFLRDGLNIFNYKLTEVSKNKMNFTKPIFSRFQLHSMSSNLIRSGFVRMLNYKAGISGNIKCVWKRKKSMNFMTTGISLQYLIIW